ncbi:MAG: arginyl-tRNA synthetase [Verrucomicrobia bacterium]|nr:arginyl-tRNA synthetase [Verrucomicrobiota bacterium]
MPVPFNLADALDSVLKSAAKTAGLEADAFAPEVRTADARHGDFQANGVLGYSKARKLNPRATAEKLVAALPAEVSSVYEIVIAGPGFINFTLKPATLQAWLTTHDSAAHLKASAASAKHGQAWVVDYSSPNTAKQMHVGHLRSAVIGEAICRLLEFSGARVVRDNHIGDWGTQFGKLIWAYQRHLDAAALAVDPLQEFERLYQIGNAAADADPAVLEQAREELVKLQAGDPTNLAVWKKINDVSLGAFQQIYDQLGIAFDVTLGESFYNDQVERIYRELTETGIAQESQGALVVFHPEHPRFKTQPFIMRKADGASNYATTDLATALYRLEHFHADGIVVVTDFRQADHFEQLFLTVKKWFAAKNYRLPELHHVTFGAVTGEDGKALRTRDGGTIKLKELLAEAEARAFALVSERSSDLTPEERHAIAGVVGVASVQYADLSQNRSSDYVFSWDKMISLEGNTAAYLLYAGARIHSIFRKLGVADPLSRTDQGSALETPAELALARKIVKFADAIRLATETLRPHFLCLYLYELAGEFSAFYAVDKVAVDDLAVRARRLQLCSRTLLVLETGLGLLGLRTLTRM